MAVQDATCDGGFSFTGGAVLFQNGSVSITRISRNVTTFGSSVVERVLHCIDDVTGSATGVVDGNILPVTSQSGVSGSIC